MLRRYPTVDIPDFQVRQLGTPQAGSIESYQQSSRKRAARRIDELRNWQSAKIAFSHKHFFTTCELFFCGQWKRGVE